MSKKPKLTKDKTVKLSNPRAMEITSRLNELSKSLDVLLKLSEKSQPALVEATKLLLHAYIISQIMRTLHF